MSKPLELVVLGLLLLLCVYVFVYFGWVGIAALRRGEAWNKIEDRPMTKRELAVSAGASITAAVICFGGIILFGYVIISLV